MNDALSDARNMMVWAISSGRPTRLSGTVAAKSTLAVPVKRSSIPVSIRPRATRTCISLQCGHFQAQPTWSVLQLRAPACVRRLLRRPRSEDSAASLQVVSDSTVLILGESGTGKELVANAIHQRSKRAVRVCGDQLRGYFGLLKAASCSVTKGAPLPALSPKDAWKDERASGGTLFLDEVGDCMEVKLLRVLQEREFERLGGNNSIPVDVRVLAATHWDLNALVAEGRFREDLLYRLNVVPIEVPPLRERVADIPLLVEYFIDRFGKKAGKKFKAIDKKSLKAFQSYAWPGNIRELQNVIERAVILSEGETFAMDEAWLKRELRATPKRSGTLHGSLLETGKGND